MCGIAGVISKESNSFIHQQVTDAVSTLSHRGPDDNDVWIDETTKVGLGHQRLCIIDKNIRSRQPLTYMDRYVIIHNGELYNYLELKQQLQNKNHHFKTESDTEVILAAYAEYHTDCVQLFEGMFAFAIWDKKEKVLFAARDRFGEKPFYFHYDEDQLWFASEMKALWKAGVRKEINKSMLYNFLTIGYTSNPYNPQETFYEGIYKLPPASFLLYDFSKKELTIEKYWQVDHSEQSSLTEKDAVEKFSSLFSNSIKQRLRSDVTVGTSLSGGLDSSAIVAFCDAVDSENYHHDCFTAIFPGHDRNEKEYAEMVAKQYRLNHHLVEIEDEEVPALLEKVMHHQEEPFSSASALAQFKIFEAARKEGVIVLLDGQGADELLAGYHKYYQWYWRELYKSRSLKSSGELSAARALGVYSSFGVKDKVAALFSEFASSILQTKKAKAAFNDADLDRDFAFSNKKDFYYSLPTNFNLNSALFFNTFTYGLEELLRLADRNSMASGIEVRLPYLNHQLVEFLFSLPPHFKIHQGWTKWLLRRSTEKLLPKEIVWRKDKVGFDPPQKRWMQQKNVQDAIHAAKEVLVEKRVLNAEVLQKKIKPHDAHAAENKDWKLWTAALLFKED